MNFSQLNFSQLNLSQLNKEICDEIETILACYWSSPSLPSYRPQPGNRHPRPDRDLSLSLHGYASRCYIADSGDGRGFLKHRQQRS
jgi:hypothetical protein